MSRVVRVPTRTVFFDLKAAVEMVDNTGVQVYALKKKEQREKKKAGPAPGLAGILVLCLGCVCFRGPISHSDFPDPRNPHVFTKAMGTSQTVDGFLLLTKLTFTQLTTATDQNHQAKCRILNPVQSKCPLRYIYSQKCSTRCESRDENEEKVKGKQDEDKKASRL